MLRIVVLAAAHCYSGVESECRGAKVDSRFRGNDNFGGNDSFRGNDNYEVVPAYLSVRALMN